MARINIAPGLLIAIPAGGGVRVLGKVLFVSQRTRNMMLVGVFGKRPPDEPCLPEGPRDYHALLYTSVVGIKDGDWPVMGAEPVSGDELRLSQRVVAGNVWIGDEFIREATAEDLGSIPEMEALGVALFARMAAQAVDAPMPEK